MSLPRSRGASLATPDAAHRRKAGVAGVADLGGAGAGAPAAAGEEDGVIGGGAGGPGGGALLPLEPAPLPEADLAAVRERIVRSLSYPPRARKMGWEGRVVVGFVLLADGRVRDLRVLSSSGHEALDEAALAAVRRAAPYPPPGRDRLVRTPVSFRLD